MPDADARTGGPDDRLLAWREVRAVTGLSRTTAWRLQNAGEFPRPVPISPGRVGWWQSELDAWKAERVERRPFSRPAPAARREAPAEPPPDRAAEPAGEAAVPPRRPEPVRRKPRRPVARGQIAFDF